MSRERVLFIDLGRRACSSGNCGLLSNTVGQWLETECLSASTPKHSSALPHLVILRTLRIESLIESVRSLGANWNRVPILGALSGPCALTCHLAGSFAASFACFQPP